VAKAGIGALPVASYRLGPQGHWFLTRGCWVVQRGRLTALSCPDNWPFPPWKRSAVCRPSSRLASSRRYLQGPYCSCPSPPSRFMSTRTVLNELKVSRARIPLVICRALWLIGFEGGVRSVRIPL
jgi:hypothetical protein